jgi:hypothetical protein
MSGQHSPYRRCDRCSAPFHRHERIVPSGTTYPMYICPDSASESWQEPKEED